MVKIEPISQSHLDLVHQYASDKRISETSNVPHPYTREMAEDWFNMVLSRQKLGRTQVFAIIYKENFAGVISLNNICLESKKAEIDYWVAVEFQGKGVATSAVREAISYGHKFFGLKSFYSGGLARNIASLAVQKKNGFKISQQLKIKEGKFAGEDYVISKYEIA